MTNVSWLIILEFVMVSQYPSTGEYVRIAGLVNLIDKQGVLILCYQKVFETNRDE